MVALVIGVAVVVFVLLLVIRSSRRIRGGDGSGDGYTPSWLADGSRDHDQNGHSDDAGADSSDGGGGGGDGGGNGGD